MTPERRRSAFQRDPRVPPGWKRLGWNDEIRGPILVIGPFFSGTVFPFPIPAPKPKRTLMTKPLPPLDRALGRLVMKVLALLARRASRRGDEHEAAHCDLQIIVGHSRHDDGWPCMIPGVVKLAAEAEREYGRG